LATLPSDPEVLSRDHEHVEGGGVCGAATLFGIQFFPDAAEEFRLMTHGREHAAREQETAVCTSGE
jgi:hypothetical protein